MTDFIHTLRNFIVFYTKNTKKEDFPKAIDILPDFCFMSLVVVHQQLFVIVYYLASSCSPITDILPCQGSTV